MLAVVLNDERFAFFFLDFRFFKRACDVDGDFDRNFRVQVDLHRVEAEQLVVAVHGDLRAVNLETFFNDAVSDIACCDGTVELACFRSLADDGDLETVNLLGDLFSFALFLQVLSFQNFLLGVKENDVFFGGAKSLLAGQQEVAGITWLDVDNVTHLAKAFHAFEQYNLHVYLLLNERRRAAEQGSARV